MVLPRSLKPFLGIYRSMDCKFAGNASEDGNVRLRRIINRARAESPVKFLIVSEDVCFGSDIYGSFVMAGERRISCPTPRHALFAKRLVESGSREIFYPVDSSDLEEALRIFAEMGEKKEAVTL